MPTLKHITETTYLELTAAMDSSMAELKQVRQGLDDAEEYNDQFLQSALALIQLMMEAKSEGVTQHLAELGRLNSLFYEIEILKHYQYEVSSEILAEFNSEYAWPTNVSTVIRKTIASLHEALGWRNTINAYQNVSRNIYRKLSQLLTPTSTVSSITAMSAMLMIQFLVESTGAEALKEKLKNLTEKDKKWPKYIIFPLRTLHSMKDTIAVKECKQSGTRVLSKGMWESMLIGFMTGLSAGNRRKVFFDIYEGYLSNAKILSLKTESLKRYFNNIIKIQMGKVEVTQLKTNIGSLVITRNQNDALDSEYNMAIKEFYLLHLLFKIKTHLGYDALYTLSYDEEMAPYLAIMNDGIEKALYTDKPETVERQIFNGMRDDIKKTLPVFARYKTQCKALLVLSQEVTSEVSKLKIELAKCKNVFSVYFTHSKQAAVINPSIEQKLKTLKMLEVKFISLTQSLESGMSVALYPEAIQSVHAAEELRLLRIYEEIKYVLSDHYYQTLELQDTYYAKHLLQSFPQILEELFSEASFQPAQYPIPQSYTTIPMESKKEFKNDSFGFHISDADGNIMLSVEPPTVEKPRPYNPAYAASKKQAAPVPETLDPNQIEGMPNSVNTQKISSPVGHSLVGQNNLFSMSTIPVAHSALPSSVELSRLTTSQPPNGSGSSHSGVPVKQSAATPSYVPLLSPQTSSISSYAEFKHKNIILFPGKSEPWYRTEMEKLAKQHIQLVQDYRRAQKISAADASHASKLDPISEKQKTCRDSYNTHVQELNARFNKNEPLFFDKYGKNLEGNNACCPCVIM